MFHKTKKRVACSTGKDIDLYKYRKQRNLVLNCNEKQNKFLYSLLIEIAASHFAKRLRLIGRARNIKLEKHTF